MIIFVELMLTYIRKKTGQQLTIRWERSMQEIVDKYPENPTQYLLPIITRQDGAERKQYLNKILFVNRKLKRIAKLAKISTPLTMYVSRHSWASIAKSKNVPLSVISEGMGTITRKLHAFISPPYKPTK